MAGLIARARASICALGTSSQRGVLPIRTRAFCGQSPGSSGAEQLNLGQRFWAWTTQPRPHWRECPKEAAVLFVVFGMTGSTSVALVRPVFKNVTGIEGTMSEGPWSYRIGSLLSVTPVYAAVLITFGTLSGRHLYFAKIAQKTIGRMVPKSIKAKLQCAQTKF